MPRSRLPLLAALLLASTPSGAEAKRIAILAGSDSYLAAPNLPGLERTLRELGTLLNSRFGYSTQLLLGAKADHLAVGKAVADALKGASPDDDIIFVYSGHGETLSPDATNASYLVTRDCDPGNPVATCLFYSVIADFSRASKARSFAMILDSCFSGAMPGVIMAIPPGLNAMDVPQSTKVVAMSPRFDPRLASLRSREGIASGSPGQVTYFDSGVGRSFFMTALLDSLRTAPAAPESCVFLKDVFPAIRDQVSGLGSGKQTPLYYRSPDPAVTGQFALCVKGVEPQAVVAVAMTPPSPRTPSPARPTVAIIGSGEDYSSYRLAALSATSSQLIDNKLLADFNTMPITVGFQWDGEGFFRRLGISPDVIVVHASAFHPGDKGADRGVAKFQAVVRAWLSQMPHVKIVVFSRVPRPAASGALCARWKSQTEFLAGKDLASRVVFYPLPRQESSFDGVAGVEMTRIVRCEAGLDAADGCEVFLSELAARARETVAHSTCAGGR